MCYKILYAGAKYFQHIYDSFSHAYKHLCLLTYVEQKAPDNGEVCESLQNCGSSIRTSLLVTLLEPRIWW